MFPSDSFMSNSNSEIGYSTGEFQAMQQLVLNNSWILSFA